MATPINYGASEQSQALAGANTYAAQTGQSIDALKSEFNTKVAELGASIVSGMNPAERGVLEKQVQDLGNRYSQSLAATQGQYAFAQQQGQLTNATIQADLAKSQEAARALAAQSLGQVAAPTGMPMTSAQLDALNAARQTGAAQLAYLGGEAAVPAGLQVAPVDNQMGLTGISALSQQLSQNALLASQARSRAELEGSRMNLETSLQTRALQAAAEREAAQREQLRTFEIQGFRDVLNAKQAFDSKAAELQAAAAAADTRTGKQKALAELELLRQKEAIQLQSSLKLAAAQNKGSAAQTQAMQDMLAQTAGQSSRFGSALSSAVANKPQSLPTTIKLVNKNGKKVEMPFSEAVTKGLTPAGYAVSGTPGIYWMTGNIVNYDPTPTLPVGAKGKQNITQINTIPLTQILNNLAGYIQTNKLNQGAATNYIKSAFSTLAPTDLTVVKYLFGNNDPATLAQLMRSNPTKSPTK